MSYLLFMDESGHDHRNMPYEVRGGIVIHSSKLWSFIQDVKVLEKSMFGCYLRDCGSEIKGSKLLNREKFKWAQQNCQFNEELQRKHALNFLNSTHDGRQPRYEEFSAYGKACLAMSEGIIQLLKKYDSKIFASIIPKIDNPKQTPIDFLRKDSVFLFERFFYFLESKQETGLIVMDGTEKQADNKFVRRMERYFEATATGNQRTKWIVPVPFFVESDMVYGVQIADMCIYCINWAYRLANMYEPVREEIKDYVWLMDKLIWQGDGYRNMGKNIETYKTCSIVYVPDPYEAR